MRDSENNNTIEMQNLNPENNGEQQQAKVEGLAKQQEQQQEQEKFFTSIISSIDTGNFELIDSSLESENSLLSSLPLAKRQELTNRAYIRMLALADELEELTVSSANANQENVNQQKSVEVETTEEELKNALKVVAYIADSINFGEESKEVAEGKSDRDLEEFKKYKDQDVAGIDLVEAINVIEKRIIKDGNPFYESEEIRSINNDSMEIEKGLDEKEVYEDPLSEIPQLNQGVESKNIEDNKVDVDINEELKTFLVNQVKKQIQEKVSLKVAKKLDKEMNPKGVEVKAEVNPNPNDVRIDINPERIEVKAEVNPNLNQPPKQEEVVQSNNQGEVRIDIKEEPKEVKSEVKVDADKTRAERIKEFDKPETKLSSLSKDDAKYLIAARIIEKSMGGKDKIEAETIDKVINCDVGTVSLRRLTGDNNKLRSIRDAALEKAEAVLKEEKLYDEKSNSQSGEKTLGDIDKQIEIQSKKLPNSVVSQIQDVDNQVRFDRESKEGPDSSKGLKDMPLNTAREVASMQILRNAGMSQGQATSILSGNSDARKQILKLADKALESSGVLNKEGNYRPDLFDLDGFNKGIESEAKRLRGQAALPPTGRFGVTPDYSKMSDKQQENLLKKSVQKEQGDPASWGKAIEDVLETENKRNKFPRSIASGLRDSYNEWVNEKKEPQSEVGLWTKVAIVGMISPIGLLFYMDDIKNSQVVKTIGAVSKGIGEAIIGLSSFIGAVFGGGEGDGFMERLSNLRKDLRESVFKKDDKDDAKNLTPKFEKSQSIEEVIEKGKEVEQIKLQTNQDKDKEKDSVSNVKPNSAEKVENQSLDPNAKNPTTEKIAIKEEPKQNQNVDMSKKVESQPTDLSVKAENTNVGQQEPKKIMIEMVNMKEKVENQPTDLNVNAINNSVKQAEAKKEEAISNNIQANQPLSDPKSQEKGLNTSVKGSSKDDFEIGLSSNKLDKVEPSKVSKEQGDIPLNKEGIKDLTEIMQKLSGHANKENKSVEGEIVRKSSSVAVGRGGK